MIPNLTLAMPEGSKWRGFNHRLQADIGDVSVIAHRRRGLECYVHSIEKVMTIPWPHNSNVKMENDHVRISSGVSGELLMTFGPTTDA